MFTETFRFARVLALPPKCVRNFGSTKEVTSTSMKRLASSLLAASLSIVITGSLAAAPLPPPPEVRRGEARSTNELQPTTPPVQLAASRQSNLGGGFIEFLFGGGASSGAAPDRGRYLNAPYVYPIYPDYARTEPAELSEPTRPEPDPKFRKQVVGYDGKEAPGTIIIDTPHRFLYLVQADGKAIRYGIGVGRPGFSWAGVKAISQKREWPDWIPPEEMLKRRPDLPRYMAGGPENPLGARALYLGSSLYRIHGSNEPWTIGQAVSSGCIRMRNEDVMDLYERVKVGTKVLVI
jgi:lipoprotein-anchoring transpeptidase ErfK/SrfK